MFATFPFPGTRTMGKFGKRFEDSPYALLWTGLRLCALCSVFFVIGFCANATNIDGVQKGISAFAGGMAGALAVIMGGGKFYFDLLKAASEEQIKELRDELEDERLARQKDKADFELWKATMEARNDALQDVIAGRTSAGMLAS